MDQGSLSKHQLEHLLDHLVQETRTKLGLAGSATKSGVGRGTGNFSLASAEGAEKVGTRVREARKRWGMVIDLQKCVGCDTCTVSCKAENLTPPGVTYNIVLEKDIGQFPHVTRLNLPRPCMQCNKPPCVSVCPVRATYKNGDGIVVIDYDRCLGCRYCMVSCPYGARSFDFGESYEGEIIGYELLQGGEYGVVRGRRTKGKAPIGTVRKCSFCFHRLGRGEEPACVETCIGDARYFGDLNNPKSIVYKLSRSPRAVRLKEELGTEPAVFYLL